MTRFAIVVDIDTDEPGAIHAAAAIRDMLQPVYGRAGTRTFTGPMFDAYFGLKPVRFPLPVEKDEVYR